MRERDRDRETDAHACACCCRYETDSGGWRQHTATAAADTVADPADPPDPPSATSAAAFAAQSAVIGSLGMRPTALSKVRTGTRHAPMSADSVWIQCTKGTKLFSVKTPG